MKKRILWVIGGVLLTVGAFFIPEQSGSIWPSVIWAGAAAVVYLVVFALYWIGNIPSLTKRRMVGTVLVLLVTGSGVSAFISYDGSARQAEILNTIRQTIDSNTAHIQVNEILFGTLKLYQQESNASFKDVFMEEHGSILTEDSTLEYGDSNTEMSLFVAKANKDSILLIAESEHIKGWDNSFINFSEATGKFQTLGILTEQGVQYERTN